jgi:carbonic anhydrase
MDRIIPVNQISDIPSQYQNSPIQLLFEYHNLGRPFDVYQNANLLVGMCMDHRNHLTMPENFAYIIRTGGANLRYSEFKVSYAIGVGQVRHIVLIGHSNCGMVNLHGKKEKFIQGMIDNAGWTEEQAEIQFNNYAPLFELGNSIDFILQEAQRLRTRYPGVTVAPLYFIIGQKELYFIKE